MIYNLVRKDVLLIKKHIIFVAIFVLFAPAILYKNIEGGEQYKDIYTSIVFFVTGFVVVFMLSNSVSMVEEKYSKGCAYLCTTPYGRHQIVISKYIFSNLIFLCYCILYKIAGFAFGDYMVDLSWELIVISYSAVILFRCVFIPLEFEFGYEKTKYLITFFMVVIPFAVPMIFGELDLTKVYNLKILDNKELLFGVVLIVAIAVNIVSALISIKIFNKKEM